LAIYLLIRGQKSMKFGETPPVGGENEEEKNGSGQEEKVEKIDPKEIWDKSGLSAEDQESLKAAFDGTKEDSVVGVEKQSINHVFVYTAGRSGFNLTGKDGVTRWQKPVRHKHIFVRTEDGWKLVNSEIERSEISFEKP
jgi:hypothetical protein